MQNTEGSCKLNELVSVASNNRLHRNIEEVENLNEPEEARLMAGFFRSTRLQRNKQVQKRNLSAIAHQIYKKRTFTRPNSQKRTRNVFTRLNNYSRTRSADGFDGSTARTGQNGKLSHQKTVNGTRNSFADREALAGFGVRPRFKVRRTAQGCKGVSPLAHDCTQNFCVQSVSCLCFRRTKKCRAYSPHNDPHNHPQLKTHSPHNHPHFNPQKRPQPH